MNVLILAAGESADLSHQQAYPTWLAEIEGELFIERQVKLLSQSGKARFTFVFRQSDIDTFFLESIVEQIAPGASVIGIQGETAGAACSALLAIGAIEMTEELIVASATDQINVDFADVIMSFRKRHADGGVLTFSSLHPRYSYVRINSEGWVEESSEKRPISRLASTGFYWFSKASDFFDSVKEMILKDSHVQDKFYICPVLNEMILMNKNIATHQLSQDQYHPLKSEKQVDHLNLVLDESVIS